MIVITIRQKRFYPIYHQWPKGHLVKLDALRPQPTPPQKKIGDRLIYLSRRAWEWPWWGCRTTGPARWSTKRWAPLLRGFPSAHGRKSLPKRNQRRRRRAERRGLIQKGLKTNSTRFMCEGGRKSKAPVHQVSPTRPPGSALDCSWRRGRSRSSPARDSPTHPRTPPAPGGSEGGRVTRVRTEMMGKVQFKKKKTKPNSFLLLWIHVCSLRFPLIPFFVFTQVFFFSWNEFGPSRYLEMPRPQPQPWPETRLHNAPFIRSADNLLKRKRHSGPNWLDMGNEFEECQSVSKLFGDIKDRRRDIWHRVLHLMIAGSPLRGGGGGHAFRRINHNRWQLRQCNRSAVAAANCLTTVYG